MTFSVLFHRNGRDLGREAALVEKVTVMYARVTNIDKREAQYVQVPFLGCGSLSSPSQVECDLGLDLTSHRGWGSEGRWRVVVR